MNAGELTRQGESLGEDTKFSQLGAGATEYVDEFGNRTVFERKRNMTEKERKRYLKKKEERRKRGEEVSDDEDEWWDELQKKAADAKNEDEAANGASSLTAEDKVEQTIEKKEDA